ncbi:MAG: serine/threonine-protein kinase [Dehalococcoidia bacterium]
MPSAGDTSGPRAVKHYTLLRLLGRGGMGSVFEGEDRRDGSRVAVKLLHPHLAASDPTYLERFEREAHVAALLRSPYTVHLLDYGVEDDQYFIVMEYIQGESLADRLGNGAIPPEEALRIGGEIARALEEAGARGIVHRDIKPENVLLDTRGRAKVTDFGIARSTTAPGLTVTGGFVGTPAFAAPEQVDGQVDHRADIYATGVTLYAMFTGRTPFQGKTAMDTLFQHRTATLPMGPLSYLPDTVQNIVRRCMEKDPLDRYQSAAELAGAIDRGRQIISRASQGGTSPASAAASPRPSRGSTESPRPPAGAFSPPAPSAASSPSRPGEMPTAVGRGPAFTPLPPPPPPPAPVVATAARSEPYPPQSYSPPPAPAGRPPSGRWPVVLLAGLGGAFAVVAAVVGVVLAMGGGDDGKEKAEPSVSPSASTSALAAATARATATPTNTRAAAATQPPPTATPTPQGGFATITGIRLSGGKYAVDFTTSGFNYSLPGIHLHFFFDTVSVEQAGVPGGGPWVVYGGGSPFQLSGPGDRPQGATRMCVLVANANHSIRPGTGNCVSLP